MTVDMSHLRTADDVRAARLAVMKWAENAEQREAAGDPLFVTGDLHTWRGTADLLADEITERAVELGLEDA